MTEARVIVDGVVQGVGYRALVKQVARQLDLKGLVRNLESTKVEIFCEGPEETIREFLKQIDRKTMGKDVLAINVSGIECYWKGQSNFHAPWKAYKGFEVDYQVEGATPVDEETLESQEFAKLYFIGFRDEMKEFRHETAKNFDVMDSKYGDISKELKEFRNTVKEFLDAYLGESKDKRAL